jgi:hypothetical protein
LLVTEVSKFCITVLDNPHIVTVPEKGRLGIYTWRRSCSLENEGAAEAAQKFPAVIVSSVAQLDPGACELIMCDVASHNKSH